ncbi:MAG: hypothetical protein LBH25_09665 [Fibromonadaceae bacterium]|jgi:hypothetical protein|nr:hypothetical protein [Fibromonadaceae bacterium]
MFKWIVLFLIIGFVVLFVYYCNNKELEVDNGEFIIESEELKVEKLDGVSIVDAVDMDFRMMKLLKD